MRSKHNPAETLLNLCDRVELLSEIVHDRSSGQPELDVDCFDKLMMPYYPCLESFFIDAKQETDVVSVDVSFREDSVAFTAIYSDSTTKVFNYDRPEEPDPDEK